MADDDRRAADGSELVAFEAHAGLARKAKSLWLSAFQIVNILKLLVDVFQNASHIAIL